MECMNVAVFGASGQTGRLLTEGAAARGHRVTVLVPADATDSPVGGVRVLRGSVLDGGLVSDAIDGQDAVLLALMDASARGERQAMAGATLNAVRSMQRYGARRLIVLSASLAQPEREPGLSWIRGRLAGPVFGRASASTLRRTEVLVRQSELDWTLVRVSRLTSDPPRNRYRVGPGFSLPGDAAIARADVASFMLDELERRLNVAHAVALAY
jgi:putative NADH-flavin reductase